MNRVVWVEAEFQEWERKEKSLFGKVKKKRTVSNCRIDGERLARDVQAAVDLLHEEGYEVVAMTPVTSGNFSSWDKGGFGYSFTEGVLVTAHFADGERLRRKDGETEPTNTHTDRRDQRSNSQAPAPEQPPSIMHPK